MGIEYELQVPDAFRGKVREVLSAELEAIVKELDPRAKTEFPSVYIEQSANGVYICDNLTNEASSSIIIRRIIDIIIFHTKSVTVIEL